MSLPQLNFESHLNFTKYNERYETEKPYAFKIPLEGADIPSSNIDHSAVGTARITDIRGAESSFSLAKNGFAIFHVRDDLSYDDYHDEIGVQNYFREVEVLLKDHLKAKDVKVFRHAVSTDQAKENVGYAEYTTDPKAKCRLAGKISGRGLQLRSTHDCRAHRSGPRQGTQALF
jgi:hypothetical protein